MLSRTSRASDLERKVATGAGLAPFGRRRPRLNSARGAQVRLNRADDEGAPLSVQEEPGLMPGVPAGLEALHGIEGLTKDAMGTVRWKGHQIDCFTSDSVAVERTKAHALAKVCRELDTKGIPVNGRTVHDHRFLQAPPASPWLRLMLTLEVVLVGPTGQLWLILRKSQRCAVALRRGKNREAQHSVFVADDHTPAWAVARQNLLRTGMSIESAWAASYRDLVGTAERAGLSPADIAAALA